MGCVSSSNDVVPSNETNQQTLLMIKQNQELKEKINQRQIELEKLKRELAHNENNLNINDNNQIRSVKQIKNSSNNSYYNSEKIKFNENLKKMEERDKKLIDQLKDGQMFDDASFEYFTQSVQDSITPIKWLRPFEIVANPIVGLEYINPNEVLQGALGFVLFTFILNQLYFF